MPTTYVYDVQMACEGCASAVKKAVSALPNVESVETSVKEQKAHIAIGEGGTPEDVHAAITGIGKTVLGFKQVEV